MDFSNTQISSLSHFQPHLLIAYLLRHHTSHTAVVGLSTNIDIIKGINLGSITKEVGCPELSSDNTQIFANNLTRMILNKYKLAESMY